MSARDCIANIVVAEISSVVNDSRVKVALTENGADAVLAALDKAGYAVVPVEPTADYSQPKSTKQCSQQRRKRNER